jgi:hypothetical protein
MTAAKAAPADEGAIGRQEVSQAAGRGNDTPMTAIRLIGEHHNSHRSRTVLTIGDETAARNSPRIVTLEHARNLVAHGVAEWIGEPPAD